MLAGVVVRAPERLQDRLLIGLFAIGPFEHNGGLREMALGQQIVPALKQLVGRLAIVVRIAIVGCGLVGGGLVGGGLGGWLVVTVILRVHARIVARNARRVSRTFGPATAG